jgi:hypothetical protein
MLGVHVDGKQVDDFLQEFDFTNKGGLDLQEFLTVLKKPTMSEEWVKTLPISEIISDAIPKISGVDPLRVISELSERNIYLICQEVLRGLQDVLLDSSRELKRSYLAMDQKPKLSGECKFSLIPMTCGTIKDFHAGIGGRIGTLRLKFLSVRPCASDEKPLIALRWQEHQMLSSCQLWKQSTVPKRTAKKNLPHSTTTSLPRHAKNGWLC